MVGRRYPDLNIVVTSPNMNTMTNAIYGTERIRLRKEYHYGEHDPCLVAQPFSLRTPHLACMPFPGSGDSNVLWALPSEDEFHPIDGYKLASIPLGVIDKNVVEQLHEKFLQIRSRGLLLVPSLLSVASTAAQSDPKVKEYCARAQYLLTRLLSPSIEQEALMTWRLAQRICLELDGRITWLAVIEPEFTKPSAFKVPAPLNVVGAITDRADFAEACYRVSVSPHCVIQ